MYSDEDCGIIFKWIQQYIAGNQKIKNTYQHQKLGIQHCVLYMA